LKESDYFDDDLDMDYKVLSPSSSSPPPLPSSSLSSSIENRQEGQ